MTVDDNSSDGEVCDRPQKKLRTALRKKWWSNEFNEEEREVEGGVVEVRLIVVALALQGF